MSSWRSVTIQQMCCYSEMITSLAALWNALSHTYTCVYIHVCVCLWLNTPHSSPLIVKEIELQLDIARERETEMAWRQSRCLEAIWPIFAFFLFLFFHHRWLFMKATLEWPQARQWDSSWHFITGSYVALWRSSTITHLPPPSIPTVDMAKKRKQVSGRSCCPIGLGWSISPDRRRLVRETWSQRWTHNTDDPLLSHKSSVTLSLTPKLSLAAFSLLLELREFEVLSNFVKTSKCRSKFWCSHEVVYVSIYRYITYSYIIYDISQKCYGHTF